MKLSKILKFIYFNISCIIILLSVYIKTNFYDVSFEQLLFSATETEGTSFDAIKEGLIFVVVGLLVIQIIIKVVKLIIKKYSIPYRFKLVFKINNKQIKINMLPLTSLQRRMCYVLFFIFSILFGCYYLGVIEYYKQQKDVSTLFEEYYVSGKDVEITFPEDKRNLIYIYLESMETTNFTKENGGIMDKSYTPNLEKLALENTNFSNTSSIGGAIAANNSGWTIAALVAQTSGIPLKVFYRNQYRDFGESLPGVYNLGDILKDNGYNNYFLLGSDVTFGGRKDYFTYHGDYEIYDYYWAIEEGLIDEDYLVWWGYEDRKLYSYAKDRLLEISKKDEPFNFTMLTVDTHFTDGYLDDECPIVFDEQYSNVFNCADLMLNDFLNWVYEQDFYENTTIVITGDHYTMQDGFYKVDKDYQRYVYNAFINSPISTEFSKNRGVTTMDIFPTTLASLGVTIEGERLGLGTNLYSGKETIMEEIGLEELNNQISKRSNYYNRVLLGDSYYEMEKRFGE